MLIFHYFARYISLVLYKSILFISFLNNEISCVVPVGKLKQVLRFVKLHTNAQFNYLSDICGVDYLRKKNRFEVVYNLLSISFNQRIRIRSSVEELQAIPSIVSLFCAANWWEREVWDMYGIYFYNHPNLRRILTDYGFNGHPLRKDFPVIGFIQVRYDDATKRISSDRVFKRAS
jgi:NADH/F420H2 dehydrogenase subunit C